MLMTPDELSRQIRLIAESELNALEAGLTNNAWKRLVYIPQPYDTMKQINVELSQLRNAIRSLLSQAANNSPNRVINEAILLSAFQTIRCLYLWFC